MGFNLFPANIRVSGWCLTGGARRLGRAFAEALAAVVRRELEGGGAIVVDYIAVVEPERLTPVVEANSGTIVAIASMLKLGGRSLLFLPSRNAVFARLNLLLPELFS